MKIIIAGGTGQVGTILARALQQDGHEVVVMSRGRDRAAWKVVEWDAKTLGSWASELEGADVVINLAGRSVNCRYTDENKKAIIDSRVDSARVVGAAISKAQVPPRIWLQMSTATIYAHRYDAPNDEASGIIGGSEPNVPEGWGFSIEVAKSWEREVDNADTPQTRKVKMRTAVVMSPDHGGPFDMLLRLVQFGLGGRNGDGQQYVSWIHYMDLVRAIYWLIEHKELENEVILAAPNPETNSEFMRDLRTAWGRRLGLGSTRWMLEIAAVVLGTETELILKSRRVVPRKLMESGFSFVYPRWAEAARNLCEEWKRLSAGLAEDQPG